MQRILIAYFKKIPVANGRDDLIGKGTYAMGDLNKRTYMHGGGGGSNFCYFVYVLVEWPLYLTGKEAKFLCSKPSTDSEKYIWPSCKSWSLF